MMGTGMGTHCGTRITGHGHSSEQNREPQRMKQRQRCPFLAEASDKAYFAFPHCPMAFPAISELYPDRGHGNPGTANHLLGMSPGYRQNYRLGCWCTLNYRYSYWLGARLSRTEDGAQMWSTNTQNLKSSFSLWGNKFFKKLFVWILL